METRVGALLDFALRQRCWQNLLPEPCQEIRPVGLVVKDRLLVVASNGEALEGARIFHMKLRAMNESQEGERCKVKQRPYLLPRLGWRRFGDRHSLG